MAYLSLPNVKVVGVSSAVPKNIEKNIDLDIYADRKDAEKFIASSHIEERRVVNDDTITSDLCYVAAEKLIKDLGWNKSEIDCLVFVSYTFDYILPSTACILQDRLGLSQDCYTLDIRYGCTGWVHGISVLSSLLSTGDMKKGILLAGDVSTKVSGRYDKSTYPLFGDAGTCTALQYEKGCDSLKMFYGTDGSGYASIIIPEGGMRSPFTTKSLDIIEDSVGIKRNSLQQHINGMDVFAFGISKAPNSILSLMKKYDIEDNEIDYYLLHQANFFMNQRIQKRLKFSESKFPCSIVKFGNTSSASIPLLMVSQLHTELGAKQLSLIACAFGVGLAWGSVFFKTDKIIVSELVEI